MKINGRDYIVQRSLAEQGTVYLEVRAWGIAVASEKIQPREARQLARLLDLAADQAEEPGEVL